MNTRIIGCGNAGRGDDAAGLLVARGLRRLGLDAVECQGEALSLLDLWRGTRRVILVDAVVTGAPPGTIHIWDGVHERLHARSFRCSTHNFGVAQAVELGRILGLLPRELRIYGIEAARFEWGAPPCVPVSDAASRLVDRIAATATMRRSRYS